jgi:hypothetical protein
MTSAIAASMSIVDIMRAPAALNRRSLYLRPPARHEAPRTSRMLPRIEPVSDALTMP